MRIRFPVIAGIALFASLAGLCVPAFLAQKGKLANLLLILPDGPGTPRIDVQRIEEFSEKEFLVSYEITGAQRLSLPHAEFSVTVIGTTSAYAQFFGFSLIEGSFFSKQAWDGKLRHAVLNETAAHAVFGSGNISGNRFKMGNDTWLVSGVICDSDETNSRVYVPSSISGGETSSLLVLMQPSNGFDETYIKSGVKALGIQGAGYGFFNLGTQTRLLRERVVVCLLVFFGLLFLSFLRPLALKFFRSLGVLKAEREGHYMKEIFSKSPRLIARPALFSVGLLLLAAAALFLFLRTASICLPWQDIPSLAGLNPDLFYPHLLRLRNLEFASRILFAISAALLGVFICVLNVYLINDNKAS